MTALNDSPDGHQRFPLFRVRRPSFIRDPYPVKNFVPGTVMAIIELFDGTHCSPPLFAGALQNYFRGQFRRNSAGGTELFLETPVRGRSLYQAKNKYGMNRKTLLQKPAVHNNVALATLFHRMADCYRYLGTEERFRAIAYENVAKMLQNMKEDIAGYATGIKALDEIKGIGESIAGKIMEYLQTGKISAFEKLKKKVPYRLLELMDITGFGPATLKVLHEQLGISNREELVTALENGRLRKIKGFGEKKIDNLKRALKLVTEKKRMPLASAQKIGNRILDELKKMPGVEKAELAGSLRRQKETIGDIDILVQAESRYRKKIVSRFINLPQVAKVLAKGPTRASVQLEEDNIQVDIRLVHDYEYGAALLYFTGSKEHNIKLRTIARNRGFKINEYGLFALAGGKRQAGATEEEIYHFLGLKFIPPEQRLDKGEIEKAMLKR